MASASSSTPAPATANTSIQRPPSLCMKPPPPSAVSSPGAASPPISLTSKEWIVPPRPKPGRKPATDTPPTKRKAQNRAAQRAFRERRAARVGELEEQMKEIEDQHEQELEALRSSNSELEQSLERCQSDLSTWVDKCRKLEVDLARAQEELSKQHSQRSAAHSDTVASDTAIGCGNCTLDSHCQCIDDVVHGMGGEPDAPTHAHRARSPERSAHKKIKLEHSTSNSMEIDFTAAFSKAPPRHHTSAVVLDPCGFCSDGTPCICAEMAADHERPSISRPNSPTIGRPGHRQMAQFTPPPSEGDVATGTIPAIMTCAGGPGTCAQCQADPNSTLFCKSLAASKARDGDSSGCCGGRGPDGGCCQSSVLLPQRATRSRTAGNAAMRLPAPTNTRNPVTLSCADAYTALSRHSAYEQASGDMASWMPKLHPSPVSAEGRPAMEIDAANVMAVLKDFDRRFGANK
ncbi:hypothetical protein PMZ80_010556 [Knufia obscura]|uniref:BZIP domain-containing protein n=2 Tax=Knufia TaxID=430999 RepID=A0AAN8I588_9EURO|nr:hypothetical protein PMZ80_010556 [Knufia obscura]KAK5950091.1 hypothetical protein OHC33_008806 [Knufia fluminis]